LTDSLAGGRKKPLGQRLGKFKVVPEKAGSKNSGRRGENDREVKDWDLWGGPSTRGGLSWAGYWKEQDRAGFQATF